MTSAAPAFTHSTMPHVVEEILSWNRAQSAVFSSSGARLARKLYRNQHPTEIAALKCMDGRLNLAVMTKTPTGIIHPFRSMGGKFSLGSPWFGDLIDEWIAHALKEGKRSVIFVTYHFSRSHNSHLGCKGWGYDKPAAQAAAKALVEQIQHVYGAGHDIVVPIVVGIETDEDALIFHGNGDLDLGIIGTVSEDHLWNRFRALYPNIHQGVLIDLFELVKGNVEHIGDVRKKHRQLVELDHAENIIAIGRGFDWLHIPNRALIVGPYDHGWPNEVATAGKIVLGNLKEGRIKPEDGVLLLCSSAFRKERGTGMERPRSELRARDLARVAEAALKAQVPELSFNVIIGTVDMDTRELHVLEQK